VFEVVVPQVAWPPTGDQKLESVIQPFTRDERRAAKTLFSVTASSLMTNNECGS